MTFREFLNKRKIDDATIERFGLYGDDKRLVIPVRDIDGKVLFNKYRILNPGEGPKYLYDKGSKATLFGLDQIKGSRFVILTEGESDAVCLSAHGFPAVSATSGCGSFKDEWVPLLPKVVFISYDMDLPGKKGAVNVHWKIPHSKIVKLPDGYKDVTEFFQGGHTADEYWELIKNAITVEKPKPKTFKFIKPKFIRDGANDIDKAKQFPITSLIEFDSHKKCRCIWHQEKSASMFYNDFNSEFPNTVKCYGCGKFGDAIDVAMQVYGLDFSGAIKKLLL